MHPIGSFTKMPCRNHRAISLSEDELICVPLRVTQAWMVAYAKVGAEATKNPLAPRVHRGFFASWHRNNLNLRIIGHVRQLMAGRQTAQLADMRVIITGDLLRRFSMLPMRQVAELPHA